MNATQRYKETGNSVCGTPPDTDTGLTREEEKEVIRESLFVLAQTGFIQIDKNEYIAAGCSNHIKWCTPLGCVRLTAIDTTVL